MTPEEAAARRAERLARARARAEALGLSIEESKTGGFYLISPGDYVDAVPEEGLPDIEAWLDRKERQSVVHATPNVNPNGETP